MDEPQKQYAKAVVVCMTVIQALGTQVGGLQV
jgi:hypothetical protein